MSKVLHTTTNNGFRLFEEYFLFSKLLAAINGNFFCVSYHFFLFLPLWCRLLLTSPYLKWVRSELNSEKCLWTLSPPGTALSTKLRHSFLIMKDQICWSGQREDRYWCLEFKQIKATVTDFRTIGSNFSDLIPEFDIVILIQRWNWIIVLSGFYPGPRLIVGDNSRSEHWNIRLRKIGNEDVEHG